jgi:hypothetical protein
MHQVSNLPTISLPIDSRTVFLNKRLLAAGAGRAAYPPDVPARGAAAQRGEA